MFYCEQIKIYNNNIQHRQQSIIKPFDQTLYNTDPCLITNSKRSYSTMFAVSFILYSVVSPMFTGTVFHNPPSSIGLKKTVMSLGFLSVPVFPLVLEIVGMRVVHMVVIVVARVRPVVNVFLEVMVAVSFTTLGGRCCYSYD